MTQSRESDTHEPESFPNMEIWPAQDGFPPTFRVDLAPQRRVWDIRPRCGPAHDVIHIYTYDERSPSVTMDEALSIAFALVGAVNVQGGTKWKLVRE